jgi:hypothetical protein
MNPWDKGVACLTAGLTCAVLVRLWSAQLIRVYRFLFLYLSLDLLTDLGLLWIPYNTKKYGYFYFSSQTVKIIVAAFVLVELYGLALEKTPALAQFGRSSLSYILAAAALIPVIVALSNRSSPVDPVLHVYLLFEQTMNATMAIFLILISIFMAWFPVRMRSNVVIYIIGFVAWTLSRSAAVYLVSRWRVDKHLTGLVNDVDTVVFLCCMLFWLVAFKREGETRTTVVGHLWNRAEAERLTEQLDAINNSLERIRRR